MEENSLPGLEKEVDVDRRWRNLWTPPPVRGKAVCSMRWHVESSVRYCYGLPPASMFEKEDAGPAISGQARGVVGLLLEGRAIRIHSSSPQDMWAIDMGHGEAISARLTCLIASLPERLVVVADELAASVHSEKKDAKGPIGSPFSGLKPV